MLKFKKGNSSINIYFSVRKEFLNDTYLIAKSIEFFITFVLVKPKNLQFDN